MNRRNAIGLAALLLLLAGAFGGSLLCSPASERDRLPPEAGAWRDPPRPASLPGDEPRRDPAEAAAPKEIREVLVRVQDSGGAPVLGAEVFLHWAERAGATPAARAFSDVDGSVRFTELPAARFRVLALADGYFPPEQQPEIALPAAVRPELVVTLERGGGVAGFVFGLDGFETPFAWLRLRELDRGETVLVRADGRGAFASGALRRGAWEVAWVEHEQAEPDPRIRRTVFVEPGSNEELIVTVEGVTRGEPRADRTVGIEPFRRGG